MALRLYITYRQHHPLGHHVLYKEHLRAHELMPTGLKPNKFHVKLKEFNVSDTIP